VACARRFVPATPRFVTTALTLLYVRSKIDLKERFGMQKNVSIKTGVKAGDGGYMGSGGGR
jgi:hypothetical protein